MKLKVKDGADSCKAGKFGTVKEINFGRAMLYYLFTQNYGMKSHSFILLKRLRIMLPSANHPLEISIIERLLLHFMNYSQMENTTINIIKLLIALPHVLTWRQRKCYSSY